jgi:hypothetical protein
MKARTLFLILVLTVVLTSALKTPVSATAVTDCNSVSSNCQWIYGIMRDTCLQYYGGNEVARYCFTQYVQNYNQCLDVSGCHLNILGQPVPN